MADHAEHQFAAAHPLPSPQAINTVQQYDGTSDPNAWLNHVHEVAEVYGWGPADCLKIAKIRLTQAAQRWSQARTFQTWQEFQQLLDQRFGETKETAIVRLERCYQRPGESPKAFADRFLQDADRAGRAEDGALVYQFIRRLQPDLREEVLRSKPQTIDAAVDFCNYWVSARGIFDERYRDQVSSDISDNHRPDYSDRPTYNSGPARRPQSEPRRFQASGPAPRAPFRDVSNRSRTPHTPAAPKPVAAPSEPSAVDDLVKRLERLEINLTQGVQRQQERAQVSRQLQDKDKTIRTLKFALERRHQDEGAQINFMGTEQPDCDAESQDEDDLDYALLAELYAKRPADDAVLKRMPAKRAAFDTKTTVHPAPRPTHTSPAPQASKPAVPAASGGVRHPLAQRKPTAAKPYSTTGTLGSAPRGTSAAAAASPSAQPVTANRYPKVAAEQANEKAKKLAAEICRSIKLDGMLEGNVPPQAVLTCLAGHLAQVPSLVTLGQEIAARVESVVQNTMRGFQLPPHQALSLSQAVYQSIRQPDKILSSAAPGAAQKTSTCKVVAHVNGQLIECVLDTGASTTAITMDCLRRMGFTDRIRPQKSSYLNADGRVTASKGRVTDLIWGVGDFQTLVHPTVTAALNYDMLIGTDVLKRANAVIDFGRDVLQVQVDPDTYQEFPISVVPSSMDNRPHLSQMQDSNDAPSSEPEAALTLQPAVLPPSTTATATQKTEADASTAAVQPSTSTPASCKYHSSEQDSEMSDYDEFEGMPALDLDLIERANPHQLWAIAQQYWSEAELRVFQEPYVGLDPDMALDGAASDAVSTLVSLWERRHFTKPRKPCSPPEVHQILTLNQESDPSDAASLSDYGSEEGETPAPNAAVHNPQPRPVRFGAGQANPTAPPASNPAAVPEAPNGFNPGRQHFSRLLIRAMQQHAAETTPHQRPQQPAPRANPPGLVTRGVTAPDSYNRSQMLNASMDIMWRRLATPGPLDRPVSDTPLGDFIRQQLTAVVFSRPHIQDPALTRRDMHALRVISAEFGVADQYRRWLVHSLASHAEQLAIPLLDAEYPALAWVLHTARQEQAREEALNQISPDPSTPTHSRREPGFALGDLEPPQQEIYYTDHMQEDTDSEYDTPMDEICFLAEAPGSDMFDCELSDDEGTLPHLLPNSESEDMDDKMDTDSSYSDLPALAADSEDFESEDSETPTVPEVYTCQQSVESRPWASPMLGIQTCLSPPEGTTPPNTPVYLEARTLPDEEACSFPDDDAMADNTHVSLQGLVDTNNLTGEEYDHVVSLLEHNHDVFCFHPSQLGTCPMGAHVIDTGDAAPIKQSYYRMPFAKQQELNTHVQKWLELGIIRPSTSPWSSPMHLVPKKGGETRAVIDYRKLNAVTRKDAYPLPRIDDILHNLGNAKVFSVVDLFNGYFQLPMAGLDGHDPHDSIAKTAFCCPAGLFEFTKMSFGMCNAPATFMRTITQVLEPYIGKFVFVFMDDVIFSVQTCSHTYNSCNWCLQP